MNPVGEKIIAEASKDAQEIFKKGEEKCAVLRERLENEYREIRRLGEERINAESLSLLRQREAISARESRMESLREKREILSNLEQEFIKEISSDSGLYRRFIINSLVGAVQSGNEEIVPYCGDSSLYTDLFVQEVRDIISSSKNIDVKFSVSTEQINEPGLLARDGRMITDARLSYVVAATIKDNESELADILFSDKRNVR